MDDGSGRHGMEEWSFVEPCFQEVVSTSRVSYYYQNIKYYSSNRSRDSLKKEGLKINKTKLVRH